MVQKVLPGVYCAKCFKADAKYSVEGIDEQICRGCQIDIERVLGFLAIHGLDVGDLIKIADRYDKLTSEVGDGSEPPKPPTKRAAARSK